MGPGLRALLVFVVLARLTDFLFLQAADLLEVAASIPPFVTILSPASFIGLERVSISHHLMLGTHCE
jgi:hypothetical protein